MISIDPVIFSIGHFMIRWYGLIVGTAIGVGVSVASREAKRKGLGENHFSDRRCSSPTSRRAPNFLKARPCRWNSCPTGLASSSSSARWACYAGS